MRYIHKLQHEWTLKTLQSVKEGSHKRTIYRDRKSVRELKSLGGGQRERTKKYEVMQMPQNWLIVVMVVHFKWVHFTLGELYLNKTVKRKKNHNKRKWTKFSSKKTRWYKGATPTGLSMTDRVRLGEKQLRLSLAPANLSYHSNSQSQKWQARETDVSPLFCPWVEAAHSFHGPRWGSHVPGVKMLRLKWNASVSRGHSGLTNEWPQRGQVSEEDHDKDAWS